MFLTYVDRRTSGQGADVVALGSVVRGSTSIRNASSKGIEAPSRKAGFTWQR
jgi:hypothetical protein